MVCDVPRLCFCRKFLFFQLNHFLHIIQVCHSPDDGNVADLHLVRTRNLQEIRCEMRVIIKRHSDRIYTHIKSVAKHFRFGFDVQIHIRNTDIRNLAFIIGVNISDTVRFNIPTAESHISDRSAKMCLNKEHCPDSVNSAGTV